MTPTQTRGLWQFLRAGVVTSLVIGIAAGAHQGAGGHLPPLALMAVLSAVMMRGLITLENKEPRVALN
ncbi:hypothetical protein [Arthrobacter sp. Z4-13]